MWRTCQGINRAGCPHAGCARVNATLPRTAWKFSETHRQKKAHHNTDWTESVQVLVSYRQEFKVNIRKLIITQTAGSIFHLHCMNITSMFSTTHQHHCAGHGRQYVRRLKRKWGRFWWVRPVGRRFRSNNLCVRKHTTDKKIHLTERMRVSWQCGWAHHSRLDTSVIASQNCVCSWAHLPVHICLCTLMVGDHVGCRVVLEDLYRVLCLYVWMYVCMSESWSQKVSGWSFEQHGNLRKEQHEGANLAVSEKSTFGWTSPPSPHLSHQLRRTDCLTDVSCYSPSTKCPNCTFALAAANMLQIQCPPLHLNVVLVLIAELWQFLSWLIFFSVFILKKLKVSCNRMKK